MQFKNTLGLAAFTGLAVALPARLTPKASQLWQPTAGTSWQYILSGVLDVQAEINAANFDTTDVYDIDMENHSAESIKALQDAGKKVVCYFSAGTYEKWRADAGAFRASTDFGSKMSEWDETWLDVRSQNVVNIMKKRIDVAAQKGCDGIDPDNVDVFDNDEAGLDISRADSAKYVRTLAEYAATLGLSTGLKNALNIIEDVIDVTQFAVNEQCMQYSECDMYDDTYIKQNKAVFHVEYPDAFSRGIGLLSNALAPLCKSKGLSTVIKTLALDEVTQECDGTLFRAKLTGSNNRSSGDEEQEESNEDDNDDSWDQDEDDE